MILRGFRITSLSVLSEGGLLFEVSTGLWRRALLFAFLGWLIRRIRRRSEIKSEKFGPKSRLIAAADTSDCTSKPDRNLPASNSQCPTVVHVTHFALSSTPDRRPNETSTALLESSAGSGSHPPAHTPRPAGRLITTKWPEVQPGLVGIARRADRSAGHDHSAEHADRTQVRSRGLYLR